MHLLPLLALLGLAAAAPLNINLGAYSPALVVGDGAIEFEGAEEGAIRPGGAAAPAANTVAAGAPAPAAVAAPAQKAPAPFAGPILNDNSAHLPIPGERQREAFNIKEKTKRDLAGFDRALQYAEVALTKGPDIELGTGAHGAGVGIIVNNNQAGGAAGREGGNQGNPGANGGTGVVIIGQP